MKSSKQPKEKVEQVFIQGSINKSPTTGNKKSSKSSGGQHQKRGGCVPVRKDVFSGILSQHGDADVDKGRIETANQMPSDIKSEDEKQHHSSAKMILQLFPVDENIRMGLEKEGHNPFLELTLSPRKKISSVITHLFNKWGSSSIAIGELMLFPFNVAAEDLTSCRKWTSSDIGIKAGDVHAVLGNQEIFRLSYGWVCFQSNIYHTEPHHMDNITMEGSFNTKNKEDGTSKELKSCNENESADAAKHILPSELLHQRNEDECLNPITVSKVEDDTAAEANSSVEPIKYEGSTVNNGISMTSLLWSDLSNISIGGLLSEASLQGKFNSENPRSDGSRLLSQPNASDTLDAFIERLKHSQASTGVSPDMPSSILDAESTCHSFAFLKQSSSCKGIPTVGQRAFSGLSGENSAFGSFKCPKSEVNGQTATGSNNIQEPKSDSIPCSLGVFNNENSLGLSSIRWNDSLGPFDLPFTPKQVIKDDSVSIGGFVR